MLSIVILFALFLNSGNNNIYAKTKNTITLSSGYLKEKYTNKQIDNFGIDLAPAALWESFADLTINLYVDASLPVISESNVSFKKIDKNTSINILYNLFKL